MRRTDGEHGRSFLIGGPADALETTDDLTLKALRAKKSCHSHVRGAGKGAIYQTSKGIGHFGTRQSICGPLACNVKVPPAARRMLILVLTCHAVLHAPGKSKHAQL